jgi:hypothetical protein
MAAVMARIASKELISGAELAALWDVSPAGLVTAIESGRLFFISSQTGERYFPAFFAEERYAKGTLGRVSQALQDLPGEAKYSFFTNKSFYLSKTPLEALGNGRLREVLVQAAGFYER